MGGYAVEPMVRQQFDVDGYWKVIVYYDLDCGLLKPVYRELEGLHFPDRDIRHIFYELREKAKAVTCSNGALHTSIVIFNRHDSVEDYINSIVHEAEHIKQAMLSTYMVEDSGEPPAYTIGYLVMRMYETFKHLLFHTT